MKVLYAFSQIIDVNSWNPILTMTDNWKRGQLRVKTQPGTSVKLIEDVIGFTIAIRKAGANDKYSEVS